MNNFAFEQVFTPAELDRLHSLVEVVGVRHDEDGAVGPGESALAEVEIILSGWGMPRLDTCLLARLPSLKAVFHAAGTVKSFITDEVWARDIRVSSAALANARPVAEFTFAMIVLALKRVWPRIVAQREQGRYQSADPFLAGAYGSTVALLGLSRAGRQTREQLRRLEVNVIAYDPTIGPGEAAEIDVELVSLEDAFSRAHVVSCHIPLLEETIGMLRRAHFSLMRPGATFINTARGAIVNEADLADVLRERPDLWAVLDVLTEEPPSSTSILPSLPNVIVTPHVAGSLGPECRRMCQMMLDDIERYLANRSLVGGVVRDDLALIA